MTETEREPATTTPERSDNINPDPRLERVLGNVPDRDVETPVMQCFSATKMAMPGRSCYSGETFHFQETCYGNIVSSGS